MATPRLDPVGRFHDVASATIRPVPSVELEAYGIFDGLRGASVLDIGTGDGRLAFGAADAGARLVIGIEPDPAALRAARARVRRRGSRNVEFRLGSAQDLPVPRERFDVALLSWTL